MPASSSHQPPPRTGDCPTLDALVAYFTGSLFAEEALRVQSHLAKCAHCRLVALDLATESTLARVDSLPQASATSGEAPSLPVLVRQRRYRLMRVAAQIMVLVGAGLWVLLAQPFSASRVEPIRAFSFDLLGTGAVRAPGAEPEPNTAPLTVVPGQPLPMAVSAGEDVHLWILLAADGWDEARSLHRGALTTAQGSTSFLAPLLPSASELPARSLLVVLATRAPLTAEEESRLQELLQPAPDAVALESALAQEFPGAASVRVLVHETTPASPPSGRAVDRPALREGLRGVNRMFAEGRYDESLLEAERWLAAAEQTNSGIDADWWEVADLRRSSALCTLLVGASADHKADLAEAERLRASVIIRIPELFGGAADPAALADALTAECRRAAELRARVLPAGDPLLTDLAHLEAKVLLLVGRAGESLERLESVRVAYAASLGDLHPRYADALNDLTGACRNLGLEPAAALYASDALRIYEEAESDPRQTIEVLRALADLHSKLGSVELARSYAALASAALHATAGSADHSLQLANAHVTHAGIHERAGSWRLARTELESAGVLYERVGEARLAGSVRFRLAKLLLRNESAIEARSQLLRQRTEDERDYGSAHPFVAMDDYLLGIAAIELRDLPEAETRLTAALRFAESTRADFDDLQERAAAGQAVGLSSIAAALSRVQLEQGRADEAFATQERGRARVLLDLLTASAPTPDAGPGSTLVAAQDRTASAHENWERLTAGNGAAAPGQEAEFAAAGRELAFRLRDEWMAESVEDPAWRQAIANGATAQAADITRLLAANELMLVYSWSETALTYLLIEPRNTSVAHAGLLSDSRERTAELALSVEQAVSALARESLSSEQESAAALHALFAALLPDALWQKVAKASVLYLVADGPLTRLPFEALVTAPGQDLRSSRFLLDDGPAIARLASASMLQPLRDLPRASPSGAGWSALLVGDPHFAATSALARETAVVRAMLENLETDGWLDRLDPESLRSSRLPETGREVEILSAIVARHGGLAETLTGASATPEGVLAHAPGKRLLHIAAHGATSDALQPYAAGLELSALAGGSPGTARLSLALLMQKWRGQLLGCELAVLSACESGSPGAGAYADFGLPLGLHCAGVPAVVATYWRVDSLSALHLTCAFLDAALAEGSSSSPAALLQAKRALRGALPDPYYWAAFQFFGDAR